MNKELLAAVFVRALARLSDKTPLGITRGLFILGKSNIRLGIEASTRLGFPALVGPW